MNCRRCRDVIPIPVLPCQNRRFQKSSSTRTRRRSSAAWYASYQRNRTLIEQIEIHQPLCLAFWIDASSELVPTTKLIEQLRTRGPRPYRIAIAHNLNAEVEHKFRAAGVFPALLRLLAPAPGPTPSATGNFVTAGGVEDEDIISPTFGRSNDEPRTGERGRFVVIADMKSRSISGLEEEILNLGPAYSLMPQAWLLTSDQPINMIRNALVQKLGKMDMLFIVDATHNKAAWFNFGPESDTRIRRVWTAQHEPIAKAG